MMRIGNKQNNYTNLVSPEGRAVYKSIPVTDKVHFGTRIKPQNFFQKAVSKFKLGREWNKFIKEEHNWNLLNEYIDKINSHSFYGIKKGNEILKMIPDKFRNLFKNSADEIMQYDKSLTKASTKKIK